MMNQAGQGILLLISFSRMNPLRLLRGSVVVEITYIRMFPVKLCYFKNRCGYFGQMAKAGTFIGDIYRK